MVTWKFIVSSQVLKYTVERSPHWPQKCGLLWVVSGDRFSYIEMQVLLPKMHGLSRQVVAGFTIYGLLPRTKRTDQPHICGKLSNYYTAKTVYRQKMYHLISETHELLIQTG